MAVGDLAGATADYRRCREIAGELESRFPAEPAYRRYRALADVKLATAERYGGDQKAADRRLEGTRPAVKELVAAFPDDPRVWDLESALTLELLGTALREDRGDDAETHARRLAELARKLAAAEPGNVPRTVTVVEADSRLALLLMERGKLDAAWKELSRATEGLAALPDPGPVGVRSLRGSVFGNLGWYHDRRKQTKEAAAAYRKSADQYVALATDFPDSPLYRYQAAESLYYCGLDRIVLLDPQEGFRLLERAAGYTAELTRTHPKDERYRELHARITGTLTRLRTRKATE
jgi:tetratricopeptide (TPR) repeat protein